MRYCEKCKVTVRTNQERCPLCQGELTGEPTGEQLYPVVEEKKEHTTLVLMWLAFTCIATTVVCLCINWITNRDYWWSLFVAAGAAMAFVSVYIAIQKRRNLLKNSLWQIVFLESALVIWDAVTGWHAWSITYFFPIGIMALLLFMCIISLVQKLDSPEYMIYLLMAGMLGLLSILFLVLHLVTVQLPSVLCAGGSLLLLAALIIFQHRAFAEELRKKFHM